MLKAFLLKVILPLSAGITLYALAEYITPYYFIKNYLADGLWAFAFVSCLSLIWKGKINRAWIFIAIISFFSFELFQKFQIIGGTADLNDVLCYFVFSAIAILTDKYSSKRKNPYEKFS